MVMAQAAAGLGVSSAKAAAAGLAGGIGAVAGIALLLPMEAGVPVPVPADLVMLAVGVRVSAGDLPMVVAVLAFEAVAVLGTSALFLLARGPGHAVVRRLGPRVGLSTT
jgi:membrane protein DedA with SNARE-associated domain